ncbi:MAG: hypothetical protein GX421_11245 [Caldisericales bacterium]|nr:hypothetical protein [Caldisericales bacterium]
MMIIIVLTHPISTISLMIILFISILAHIFYYKVYIKNDTNIKKIIFIYLKFLIYLAVFAFAWWTFASGSLNTFANLLKWGLSIDYFISAPRDLLNYPYSVPLFERFFNQIGFFLFFSMSLVGFFYMISNKCDILTFSYAICGFTILALGFLPSSIGITLIEPRWWFLAQILLSIPLAATIFILINLYEPNLMRILLFTIFIISFTFMMITSNAANLDNSIFSPNTQVRFAFTESEMASVDSVSKLWKDTIRSDIYYANCSNFYYGLSIIAFDKNIYEKNFSATGPELILIRNEILYKPFWLFATTYKLNYDPEILLDDQRYSKIYDIKTVRAWCII